MPAPSLAAVKAHILTIEQALGLPKKDIRTWAAWQARVAELPGEVADGIIAGLSPMSERLKVLRALSKGRGITPVPTLDAFAAASTAVPASNPSFRPRAEALEQRLTNLGA